MTIQDTDAHSGIADAVRAILTQFQASDIDIDTATAQIVAAVNGGGAGQAGLRSHD